ncbi:MAG: hypothetical protein K2P38_05915 [Lachnospiraceae bacterium]|nr:hypothetical protein [Lachnospiraceae bacterium]
MNYNMEELAPIVAKLAEKYTAGESTSVTYEKAEQLMGAVLYCIREVWQQKENSMVSGSGIEALKAYETGLKLVEGKVRMALELYNEMILDFNSYGSKCLYDTFVKGIPEFFKWYDMRFEPQNTILTLDYPVREDLSVYSGIDRIYAYILCIRKEQELLRRFSEEEIKDALRRYHPEYEDLVENICEMVSGEVILTF